MEDDASNLMRPPLQMPPRKIVFRRRTRTANGTFVAATSLIPAMDAESVRRRFGWTSVMLANTPQHLPYIYRRGEKFCPIRIFESSIINNKHHVKVHEDVYKFCTQATIKTHTITEQEASLLNEINWFHCDSKYGTEKFTTNDTIFRLFDATHFARFVMTCGQLAEGLMPPMKSFGLIHINKRGVVPYVVADDRVTYVPVCFFSDDHKLLRNHKTILGGWNMPFLKLSAQIMNVGMDFLTEATCVVVDLNIVKSCFPTGTTFEQYWPIHDAVSRLVCSTNVDLSWLKVVPYDEHIQHVTKDVAVVENQDFDKDPLEI